MQFKIPKKPKVKKIDAPDEKRKFIILPYRCGADRRLSVGRWRVLATVASFCNRAGITWASQERMAKDLGISKQVFGQHMIKLTKLGYLEKVGGFCNGRRGNVMRMIFDPSLNVVDAVAISNEEVPEFLDAILQGIRREQAENPSKSSQEKMPAPHNLDKNPDIPSD